MTKVNTILHSVEPMRVDSLVRWPEFPDRFYFITEMPIKLFSNDYTKLKTVDNKHISIVPIKDLMLDDIDYDEI